MSETTHSTSILDELTIGEPMSQRQGVKCCPAIREGTDERYIVKILSIPASQVQLDALLLTGAYSTPAHALEYFHKRAEEAIAEVDVLKRMHAMEGFLPYTHAEIRKGEDDIGYQVYLISPYKRSLERQMQLEPLTHLGAVNLGLDLCAALAICRRAGYLYIDLKPSNVFITPNQGYRISDLGFISLKSLKYASYPEQYRSSYTAPEIADAMSSLNSRIDIYALGLILYQVYNNGELPQNADDSLPPPAYADYEIAEIIMKACDPNPVKRWADPLQMGQAIVAYMQRNSVNDTPIVPPPVELPPEPVVEEPEQTELPKEPETLEEVGAILDSILENINSPEQPAEDTVEPCLSDDVNLGVLPNPEVPAAAPDAELDLSFMEDAAQDETVPTEESAADIQEELVTDEVLEILARADELLAHELPEPAVAPEPIDIPFPAPIVLPAESAEEPSVSAPADSAKAPVTDDAQKDVSGDVHENAAPADEISADEDVPADADTAEDAPEDWDEVDPEYQVSEYYSDGQRFRSKHPKRTKALIITTVCLLLLAALITGGILFYRHYYLQPVHSFNIYGSVDSLTVEIGSSIDSELLTVVCTDIYGNARTQEVINGRAHFTNLVPNTRYEVDLNISGFHRLSGTHSGNFTTAAQTEILNFNAVPGPEDGSVELSFTVKGPDTESWIMAYSTGNSPEQLKPFPGHHVLIDDLIIGNEYLFRLIPSDDQYLAGTWQLRYTPQKVVTAKDLALSIRSCANGTLVAGWDIPAGMEGQSWNVRCYNDNGYDQSITTTDAQAQFTGLDHNYGYTVEVAATGMYESATVTVSPNPITLSALTAKEDKNNILQLNWTYSGEAPAEGWLLTYTIDGASNTLDCAEASAQVTRYPGSTYTFDVRPKGGEATYYGQSPLTYEVPKAARFSNYGVKADNMKFYMCLTPEKADWNNYDVPGSDYKTAFKVGEKASFLVELFKDYQKSDAKVTVTYIIRDENKVPVSLNSVETTWNKLWDKQFCDLNIPQMPKQPGKYTIEILFNGQLINNNDKTDDILEFSIE